jgi:hypothetical protein
MLQDLIHADGTLNVESLLAMHAAKFGDLRMEGDGGEGGAGGSGDGGVDGGQQWTPPGSQADLDRIIQDRVRRATAKFANYDDLRAKAEKHDALEAELGSAADKAAKAARDEERAKLTSEYTPRVVKAEFKAAAKGVLSTEQLDALLEDLDLSKYVTDSGDVDEEKVTKKVTAFAPADDGKSGGSNTHQPRNLGQGNHQQAQAKPGDAGRAMAEKRFKKTGS